MGNKLKIRKKKIDRSVMKTAEKKSAIRVSKTVEQKKTRRMPQLSEKKTSESVPRLKENVKLNGLKKMINKSKIKRIESKNKPKHRLAQINEENTDLTAKKNMNMLKSQLINKRLNKSNKLIQNDKIVGLPSLKNSKLNLMEIYNK